MYHQIKEVNILQQGISRRTLTIVVLSVFLLLAVVLGFNIYNSVHFRLTGTNPSTDSVSTLTPFFKVYFNHNLDQHKISVSSTSNFVSSSSIQGKIVTINFNTPLGLNDSYSFTLKNIVDTTGKKLSDRTFSFMAKDIPLNNLPKDQQEELLRRQQSKPSVLSIGFTGDDQLQNYGLTSAQDTDLRQAFFNFKKSTKTVVIDTSSIKPTPHDRNSGSTSSEINFSVKIDGTFYSAKISYSNLTILRLYLSNDKGSAVFDSQDINSQALSD